MRKHAIQTAVIGICGLSAVGYGQNVVSFSTSDPGVTKSVGEWGIDTAWPNSDNVRQSIANIGAANVDVARVTFEPSQPLIDNGNGTYSLNAAAKANIDTQLSLVAMAGFKPLTFVTGATASTYDPVSFVRTIKATQEYVNSKPGWTTVPIKSIEAFNEPDWAGGEGTRADLNNAILQLKAYPVFQNTAFPAASTLNSDNARSWYDGVPAATAGSSHLLGGSLTSYVNFMEYVKATGKTFTNPELHSLGEAIVGAEHGMTSGIFWADVLRARGLFVQASDGKRLGYYEDLGRQSAAAVYRAPDGKMYAFAGGLERFGAQTSYRFVSTDRDVYFNGLPVREYTLQTKWDETNAANPPGNDFDNYGSWSNQGAYADVETGAGMLPLDGYRWKIVNAQTGQAMEVASGATADGATIRGAADAGAAYQKWDIVRTRNGYVELFNANSGRTAEVANGSLANNAAVRQWGTADNSIQQWYVEDAGGGTFFVRNAFSNKFLSSNTTGGVFQFDKVGAGTNLQKWRFVLANPNSPAKAQYTFQGNVNDSVGANHATVSGAPTYAAGPSGQGQAISLNGTTDYVKLPSGLANTANLTIAAYVKWDGGNAWQRIFDFGNDTNSYMFLTPGSAANTMRFAIKASASGGEQILDTSPLPIGQWVHLTLTLGGNTGVLYVDGKPRSAGEILLDPAHFNPTLNYIGKSQYNDPLFDGMVDEFRVYDYALDPGQVASFVFHRWTGEANGNWTSAVQVSPKNWMRNVAATDYVSGASVLFDDFATNFNVNIADASVTPGSVQVDNRNNNYTFNGPGSIAGSGTLTKNGAGALTLNNVNTYSGGTVVNNGSLILGNPAALGTGPLTVQAGASVAISPAVSGTIALPSLTLFPGSSFDLANAALLSATPAATLRSYLLNRLLISSLSDATHGLGFAPSGTSLLARLTLIGDANLDGDVTPDDFALVDKGFRTGGTTWYLGDFNYDGAVTGADYLLIDSAYLALHPSGASSLLATRESQFGRDYTAVLIAAVPEPDALTCVSLPALLTRRRRYTKGLRAVRTRK